MTSKQGYAIYLKTGYDVRELNLTNEDINKILHPSVKVIDAIEIVKNFGGIFKRNVLYDVNINPEEKNEKFEKIYNEANEAGINAVNKLIEENKVIGMRVVEHLDPLNDNSSIKRDYGIIADGPCGFAWVNVKPGNSAFAKWLKEKNYARTDSYYGGVTIWVSEYNQSMQKKEVYAHAFADVLRSYNIKAYAMSRMD